MNSTVEIVSYRITVDHVTHSHSSDSSTAMLLDFLFHRMDLRISRMNWAANWAL
jgi:hypothetical protein